MEFIGVVFEQLFKVALKLAKSMKFQPILGQIESTLVSLKPLIEEMVGLNMGLKLKSEAIDKLQDEILKGLVLVRKCVKCSKVNFPKRIKYKKKLEKLDNFLKSLLQELKVEETRNVMLNLLLTTETSKKVDEMANDVKEILLGTVKHGGLLEELLQGEEESLLLIRKNYDQIERSEKEQKQFRGLVEWSMVNVPSKDDLPPINWDEVKASTLPVGFDKPMEELKTDLLKNGFQMLGLTGLQGSGKTTLAKLFCQDKDVKGRFKDNIFFVHVSKELSCGDIVRRIVRKLNKYKKTELPDNIDDKVIAVEWLQQFLNKAGQNPILLVLDDVWPGSEFLLKKFNECKMSNCKILVTSIYNFPGFSSRDYFEPLDEYNAIILLQHSASRYKPACFTDDFARKVVERCRGFPLAIEEVGRSLGDRATESWDKSLSNWYENSSIIDSETDFFGFLQSSKDTLNEQMDTVKECFMDLGSFPENQRIPVAALIEIWAVLYKLEDAPSISNLYELTNQSLANHIFTMYASFYGKFYSTVDRPPRLSLSLSLRDSASPLLLQSSSASSLQPRVLSLRQRPSPFQPLSLFLLSDWQAVKGCVSLLTILRSKGTNYLFWSPSGGLIILARLNGSNGNLEFFNVDELRTVAISKHIATALEWNPTGRYVATSTPGTCHEKPSFNIWSFDGHLLYQLQKDLFTKFSWRPRPLNMATKAIMGSMSHNSLHSLNMEDDDNSMSLTGGIKKSVAFMEKFHEDLDAFYRLDDEERQLLIDLFYCNIFQKHLELFDLCICSDKYL